MHVDVLRDALRRQPFRPFTLRLVDGRTVFIQHPELILVSPRQVIIVHPDESTWWLEPMLLQGIEFPAPVPPPSAPPANGPG
jgi:hypothetical protein